MMTFSRKALAGLAILQSAFAVGPEDIRTDPLTKGPDLEIVCSFLEEEEGFG